MFTTTSWSIWRSRNASLWEDAFARVVEVIYRGNVLLKEWREHIKKMKSFDSISTFLHLDSKLLMMKKNSLNAKSGPNFRTSGADF